MGQTSVYIELSCAKDGLLIAYAVKNASDVNFNDPDVCFHSEARGITIVEKATKLTGKIFPGHDSSFSLSNGNITRLSVSKAIITDFVDWKNRNVISHVLPRG